MMMMLMNNETTRSNPTIQVPPLENHLLDDPTIIYPMFSSPNAIATSPNCSSSPFDALTALHRYLPSNKSDIDGDCELTSDAFSCDHFRMYEFKVRKCPRGRSHDWTECPFAHPGEKARRRDPRKHHYSGAPCPDFRKGQCFRGDACEYAHGVFECWLHPARYRTMPCKDGAACRRRVCFFAHAPGELRVVLPQATSSPRLTESYDGSPARLGFDSFDGSPSRHGFDSFDGSPSRLGFGGSSSWLVSDSVDCFPNRLAFDGSPSRLGFDSVECGLGFDPIDNSPGRLGYDSFLGSSPTSILYSPGGSPPSSDSPPVSPDGRVDSVSELAASIRSMQIGGYGLPRGWVGHRVGSGLRPGFMSGPSTPTRAPARSGLGAFEICEEEAAAMERVESGRDLRARMYAKLSKENSLGRVDSAGVACPDVGWVSELVK